LRADAPELDAGPEQWAMREELSARMADLLRVLPAKQREILVLRVMVGMSAEETAVMVGSTRPTWRSRGCFREWTEYRRKTSITEAETALT
jgi:DNA-directed RNA polymerase specialized sigma24 family protein